MDILELTTTREAFEATRAGRRRAHPLVRTVAVPHIGDPVKIAEVVDGNYSGRADYARITWVDTLRGPLGPMHVVSIEICMSTDRMPALTGKPTPTGEF